MTQSLGQPCDFYPRPPPRQVVLDYIGYSDLPPFGAAPDVAAPNIARLSAEGRRFTQFYAAALAIGGRVIQTPLSIF